MTKTLLSAAWTVISTAVLLAQTNPLYRIDTVAGSVSSFEALPATTALLGAPTFVLPDSQGGFYFADANRYRIRYVAANGVMRTVVGNGVSGPPSPGGGVAIESSIGTVLALAQATNGDLYFAEFFNCQVSRVDAAGMLRPVAGTGTCGYGGDRGPATSAQLNQPQGLAFDPQGRLLIADTNNSRIRRINTDGTIETIAGTGDSQTFAGEGTLAPQTPIAYPLGLASAPDGTLFVGESGYRRVRRIAPNGTITTVAGTGFTGNSGDGGPAVQARFQSSEAASQTSCAVCCTLSAQPPECVQSHFFFFFFFFVGFIDAGTSLPRPWAHSLASCGLTM